MHETAVSMANISVNELPFQDEDMIATSKTEKIWLPWKFPVVVANRYNVTFSLQPSNTMDGAGYPEIVAGRWGGRVHV